jgi:uncharacterized protein (TIGR02145 family)
MKKRSFIYPVLLLGFLFIFVIDCKKDDPVPTVTDKDGNVYHMVVIGTQTWMVENLRTTKYRDGTSIPVASDNAAWKSSSSGKCCYYNNVSTNAATYGCLYNWYAVSDSRNLAPAGWHVANSDDWGTLTDYLGGSNVAGGKLKETAMLHWKTPNTSATNESGFTALAGGYRDFDGTFRNMGDFGFWWTTSEDAGYGMSRQLSYNSSSVVTFSYSKFFGYSVRCVKD